MPVAESSVLRPKQGDLKNPDDWPIFNLTKANVISQITNQPCSLLDAHKNNKVKVIGRLCQLPDELAHLVLDPKYEDQTIQIDDVTVYSYAEYDDGTYGFWAAGKAGWFELEETVASYKPTIAEMNVATSMLYFVADKIRRSRKTDFTDAAFNKHIRRLFHDYLMQAKFPHLFADVADVREGFEQHRHFLISAMLEGQEGITWTEAPLLQYYTQMFPSDVQDIKSRVLGLSVASRAAEPKKQNSGAPSIEPMPPKKRRGRPPKNAQSSQPRTPSTHREIGAARTASDGNGDEDMDEDSDGDEVELQTVPRKRKSILQPSGSKYSKKAKKGAGSRRGRIIPENPYLSNDDNSDEQHDSPITTIANGRHLSKITNRGSGRRRGSSPPPPDFLPRKFLELKVIDIDIENTKPQGPGDLWTCPFEDCSSRVHNGMSKVGQEEIREHLKSHQHVEDRIHLAINESRPYLPVDNLVRRLQAIAPDAGSENLEPLEAPSRHFIAPIRRKY